MLMSYWIHFSTLRDDINLHLRTIKVSFLWLPVMDLHCTNEKTHISMLCGSDGGHSVTSLQFFCPFSRGKKPATISLVRQTTMHCMTSNKLRSRILQSSLSEFILWFQCSVRELISKPKKSKLIIWLIARPPTRNHTEKCVSYPSWYKSGEKIACTASVQFLFRSLVRSFFFSLDTTFRWSAVVNLPETDHSTSLLKSCLVLLVGDHPNHSSARKSPLC